MKPNVRLPHAALSDFAPGFTVLHAPYCHADPDSDGTNSECFVVVNFDRRLVLVGGTVYAGEIKKSIFNLIEKHSDHEKLVFVFSNTSSHTTAELAVLWRHEVENGTILVSR